MNIETKMREGKKGRKKIEMGERNMKTNNQKSHLTKLNYTKEK